MRHRQYEFPQVKQNPTTQPPVRDWGWATDMIARAMPTIEQYVPPQWAPRLQNVAALEADMVTANLRAYGCGSYGCVYPTHDPAIVMKVTEDDTEAQFASELAAQISRPICVKYNFAIRLDERHKGHTVHLLWRESADHIGQLQAMLGAAAPEMVKHQYEAAKLMYEAIYLHQDIEYIRPLVRAWLNTCEQMARQTRVPALRELGDGLVETFTEHGIVFGDIHSNNLGVVHRDDGDHWVITDPGHVAVIHDY